MELSKDPLINSVYNGIIRDIKLAYDNESLRSCLILIYCGIDAMAYLNMPEDKKKVSRADFIEWSNKYIKFQCPEKISGEELYGARCAIVHTYTSESEFQEKNKLRMVLYMNSAKPEIIFRKSASEDHVLVSVEGLKDSFIAGVNEFMIQCYSKPEKAKIVQERLTNFFSIMPYKQE